MRNRDKRWRPDAESPPVPAPDSVVQTLFEHAWDAFAVMDVNGRIRYVSPANSRILGYSADELVGRIGFSLVHPDDLSTVESMVETVRQNPGSSITRRHRLRTSNGSWRRLETTMQNMLDHRAIQGLVVHSRDITDRDVLHAELAEAKQRLQRVQLHPHFVLNVLQTIQTQLLSDPDVAADTIAEFGELLRLSYEHVDDRMAPLGHEIDFVVRYIDLYRHRFSHEIEAAFEIPDDLRPVPVPSLLLQPLVENALRHGLEPAQGGHLSIRARRVGDTIRLSIVDDGVGITESPNDDGVGLPTTRKRLEQIYGPVATLEIAARPEGGTVVTVDLPVSTKSAP